MTVTFEPEPTALSLLVLDWRIECLAGTPGDPRRFPTEVQALAGLADHHQHCRSDPSCWPHDPPYVRARTAGEDEPRLNVSSANARSLLRALGLRPELGADAVIGASPEAGVRDVDGLCSDDLTGVIEAGQMLERIALALALHPDDPGMPARVLPGPGAQFIDCGRRAGYLQNRLAELEQVARYAAQARRRVQWT